MEMLENVLPHTSASPSQTAQRGSNVVDAPESELTPTDVNGGEILVSDISNWVIGPFHSMLPSPFRLDLDLDGEVVCRASIKTGYCFKGLEPVMEASTWQAQVIYADHLDSDAAFFGELVLVSGVEALLQVTLSKRMQGIRIILSELCRIVSHLGCLVKVANACGAQAAMHYILRDRESFLDLFELLTGSRFAPNYLRYGGTCAEMTDGFVERVLQVCDQHRIRLKEYNDILTFSESFVRRTAGVGVLSAPVVREYGVTGPNARAAGVSFDVRKQSPYLGYEKMDFDVCLGSGTVGAVGDCHDRVVVRLREIIQSTRILKQQIELLDSQRGHDERLRVPKDYRVPSGESYVRVEGPRGLIGCHLISDGKTAPRRVQFRTPSTQALQVIPSLLKGAMVSDVAMILASLDISIAEADK